MTTIDHSGGEEAEMRPEYDFSGAPRGKYAQELKEQGYTLRIYNADGSVTERQVLGEKVVVLEPDVWEYFPDSESVNRALRALISIAPARHTSPAPPGDR